MDIALYIGSVLTAAAGAFLIGMWIGRRGEGAESVTQEHGSAEEGLGEEATGRSEEQNTTKTASARGRSRTFHKEHTGSYAGQKPGGWEIGSPAAGEISFFYEGSSRGVTIHPRQGMLYAPAAGKIIKLYPTGNAFLLRTDYGMELLIKAGVRTEELEGLYYRPRVVQNEIVNKGKLLLEYDMEAIVQEGYDASIRLSVEDSQLYKEIVAADTQWVKNGEGVLWVNP